MDRSVELGRQLGIHCRGPGYTADVERPQRKLGTRLADGLGGNDADCIALLGGVSAGQVLAIAFHTHAPAALAGEHRTDIDRIDAAVLYLLRDVFRYLLPC